MRRIRRIRICAFGDFDERVVEAQHRGAAIDARPRFEDQHFDARRGEPVSDQRSGYAGADNNDVGVHQLGGSFQ